LERFEGFFYNYYDTTTLERTSNFVSFVDSSWLTAGLMVVRMAFPELHERATRLIEQGNYGFFYDDVEQHMLAGLSHQLALTVRVRVRRPVHESRLAASSPSVKATHRRALVHDAAHLSSGRVLAVPDTQQSESENRSRASNRGGTLPLERDQIRTVLGGSMFEALMPTLLVNEQEYAQRSLGSNDEAHATIQRRYAFEELGYPVWGISPSATPGADRYAEYGVKVLGSRGYRAGVVTPHAAALALT